MDSKVYQWMKRIHDTQVEEIDCSACLDQISAYVDVDLTPGDDPTLRMPQVAHHLNQCEVCFEEYQVLRDLANMESAGMLPSTDDLIDRLKKPPK